jgi:hypothetical protein
VLLASAAIAAETPPDGRTLLAADAARMQAMVAGDGAALERVLADDLSYGHSDGRVQGKSELLEALRTGKMRYRTLTAEGAAARVYGCAGIVTARVAAEVETPERTLSLVLRYTATYAWRDDHWALVAYQSVRLP